MRRGWESWGCSAWRREGCGETLNSPPVPEGAYRKDGENIFGRDCCDRTRSNGFKLTEGRFRLDIRKKIFALRVTKPGHKFPREVVGAPSLEMFQGRLDVALGNLIQLKMSLLMAGGWARWPLKVPSSPKHSVIITAAL